MTVNVDKVEPGVVVETSNVEYKIVTDDGGNYSVKVSAADTQITSVIIPDYIKINGVKYKVSGIAGGAFKNIKTLKKVTIGKNVTKIPKNAFKGCSALKTIVIKSKKLTGVGKNAIKGIHKKAVIKCPQNKLKKYQKLFNAKTGFKKKTMKIKGK